MATKSYSDLNADIVEKLGSGEGNLIEMKRYTESAVSISSSGGVLTLDLSNPATVFYTRLFEAVTSVTLTNVPSGAVSVTLEVTQDPSTPRAISWGSGWLYHNSEAPAVTETASAIDFFVIYTRNGGTTKIVAPSWSNITSA